MRKTYLALILGLINLPVSEASPVNPSSNLYHPNLFQCNGLSSSPQPKEIRVTYSTTSITGKPQINIQLGDETVSRSGNDIQTQETVLGELVITRDVNPDGPTETRTIIIPDIHLSDQRPRVRFKTRLFATREQSSIAGPGIVEGLIQSTASWPIRCKASSVNF